MLEPKRIYTELNSIFCTERVGCAERTTANVDIDRSYIFLCHFDWSKSLETQLKFKEQQTALVVKGFCGMEKSGTEGNDTLSGVNSQCVRCLHSAQSIVALLNGVSLAERKCASVGMTQEGAEWLTREFR